MRFHGTFPVFCARFHVTEVMRNENANAVHCLIFNEIYHHVHKLAKEKEIRNV